MERFPEKFCFQLTKDEMGKMWFQNGTTSNGAHYSHIYC
ncbi:MAG: ORF6N domain-containing protein [Clostridia bacterium]|nr:ORF6N domain-containing protein [Clostridia bacterium]